MRPKEMEFYCESAFGNQAIQEAYERLRQDVLMGDISLFIESVQIQ